MQMPLYPERFHRMPQAANEPVRIHVSEADDDGGAWAAVCKRNADQALAGRSARIKSAIAQMETICPPIGAQP